VFCFSSAIALSSKNGRVAMCLDECLEPLLADESALRIFTSEAVFPDGLIVSQARYRAAIHSIDGTCGDASR
jgi:hypothetical protein